MDLRGILIQLSDAQLGVIGCLVSGIGIIAFQIIFIFLRRWKYRKRKYPFKLSHVSSQLRS